MEYSPIPPIERRESRDVNLSNGRLHTFNIQWSEIHECL